MTLADFVRESNAIEGIHRQPTAEELTAFDAFMRLGAVRIEELNRLQAVFAPDKPIRSLPSMNVRVGNYRPPPGGPEIVEQLNALCATANSTDPWSTHVAFEMLHPYLDGNGRTGRALWAWQMRNQLPFEIPFLQRFYYQTLAMRGGK